MNEALAEELAQQFQTQSHVIAVDVTDFEAVTHAIETLPEGFKTIAVT